MLLTATGLARVGLLTEDYFLKFDEPISVTEPTPLDFSISWSRAR
jgi:hypothetical protein